MGNKDWNRAWKSHLDGMYGLAWLPSAEDSHRVQEIIKELKEIVDRNTLPDEEVEK